MIVENPFTSIPPSKLHFFKIFQLFAFATFALSFGPAKAAIAPPVSVLSLPLSWNAVPQTDIQGYRVYVGLESGQYTQQYDVGTVLNYSVGDLAIGQTYYIAVKAIGSTGLESDFSEELPVTVTPQPMVMADSYATLRDTPLSIPASGVLGNDTDLDSPTISAVLDETPNHGTVVLNSNGGFVYTPNVGFTGSDSFVYHATDGTYNSEVATVSINIKLPTAQLIVNGSFESEYSAWTATGNHTIESAVPYVPTDGSKLIAFNGQDQQANGMISQSFGTVVGQTYSVEFDAGAIGYNTNSQNLDVTIQGENTLLAQTVTINGTGTGANRWLPQTFSFVADSTSATLAFKDTSISSSSIDLMLDNVRVTGAPASEVVPTVPGLPNTASLAGSPGAMTVSMTATKAGSYVLERSEDLVNWQVVETTEVTAGTRVQFFDSQAPATAQGKMFYRIGYP